MKIAINADYGSFSLSHKACERLIELGVPVAKTIPDDFGHNQTVWGTNKKQIMEDELDPPWKYNGYWFRDTAHRTDLQLIQVIEELGEDASDSQSKLKIIEVPNDVEWTIENDCGWEYVAEKHRLWECPAD